MNYCEIKTYDIADGPGVRVSLFVSGCTHHCPGCFQPQTWDFQYGEKFDGPARKKIINALSSDYIEGLTLLGGEPFEPDNQRVLVYFLQAIRDMMPEKNIWSYTGFTWEELTGEVSSHGRCNVTDEMLSLIDVLVDGPFIEEQKDISLRFRGSRNQRIIDVQKSLKKGEIVLWQS